MPIVPSLPTIQQLVKQKSDRISFLEAMLIYQIYTFAVVSFSQFWQMARYECRFP